MQSVYFHNSRIGVAVSLADTMLRWDVRADPMMAPPVISPVKINVYEDVTPMVISEPSWQITPIYRIRDVKGQVFVSGAVPRREVSNQPAKPVIAATVSKAWLLRINTCVPNIRPYRLDVPTTR